MENNNTTVTYLASVRILSLLVKGDSSGSELGFFMSVCGAETFRTGNIGNVIFMYQVIQVFCEIQLSSCNTYCRNLF